MATRETKLPSIPDVPDGLEESLTSFLSSIKESIEIREGRADALDRTLIRRDLQKIGIDVRSLNKELSSYTFPNLVTDEWNYDIKLADGRFIKADKIRARNGDGLLLENDGGKGVKIADGGYFIAEYGIHVGGTADPGADNLVVDGRAAVGRAIIANTALVGEAPTGQSVIWQGVVGRTRSGADNNYGVYGNCFGTAVSGAVNNYGVYGHASGAGTLNHHFRSSSGAFCTDDWHPPSKRAYKSDILEFKDLDFNSLYDDLDEIKPVRFRYKKIVSAEMDKKTGEELIVREDNPDAPYIYGFIADDPDVSDFLRDVDRQSWSPSSASAYALLCIKRQKQIIQEQNQIIQEHAQRIKLLEAA